MSIYAILSSERWQQIISKKSQSWILIRAFYIFIIVWKM